jgi:S1-C subfamily serine protease
MQKFARNKGAKMRRIVRIVAILLLLGFGIAGWKYEREPKPRVKIPTTRYHGYEINREAINRAKAFTVLISNEGFEGVSRGTGILIDATHVLTCAHMIEGPQADMWIYPYPVGLIVKGKPVFVNREADLAILELSKAVVIPHYATFMDAHYDGEPITIIGNTLGSMKWFVSFGIISGEWDGFLLTDGVLYGGNSGGPWINEQGEVVALTDWTLLHKGKESGIHGGVSSKTINEFLKT